MYGALIGGLVIGLVESWAGLYLSGTWMNAIAFLVLVLVLVVRPSGLVGSAYYAARVEV
jgi:branched-chain amino acid transport system permease protein